MKKIFIISTILLSIVLFFLGIYNFAFKKNTQTIKTTSSIEQVKNSQQLPSQKLKKEKLISIVDDSVVSAAYDKKNNYFVFFSYDGKIWKVDSDGINKKQISDSKISNIKNVIWSPDRNKALINSEVNGDNVFYMYDLQFEKSLKLKKGLDTAVWDNLGSKILYKYFDETTGKRTLNIANPDGSEWQKLTDINNRNILISPIPLSSLVSFWNYSDANEVSQLQTVGIAGSDTRVLFNDKYGADYLWSPNGTMALVSSLEEQNSKKITLGLVKIDGTYNSLNIPTIASKCVWSVDNKTIYYALPGGIPNDATMPNDYQSNKFVTKDFFWKMDITTGKQERLIDPSEMSKQFDSINLALSPTEDALFFINKIDKKIYKLEF